MLTAALRELPGLALRLLRPFLPLEGALFGALLFHIPLLLFGAVLSLEALLFVRVALLSGAALFGALLFHIPLLLLGALLSLEALLFIGTALLSGPLPVIELALLFIGALLFLEPALLVGPLPVTATRRAAGLVVPTTVPTFVPTFVRGRSIALFVARFRLAALSSTLVAR